MTHRVGHARPVGTTWRMRLRWHGDGEPELGDLVYETLDGDDDPETLCRGFEVVGVEEGRPRRWVVVLERVAWGDWLERVVGDVRVWSFIRDRR